MRDFTRAGAGETLSPAARVLYTAFVAFTLVGLLSSVALYHRFIRFSATSTPRALYQNLVDHHQGPEAFARLLEVTHAHLFSIPVVLLVMGHLLLLTRLSASTRLWMIGLGVTGTALHLLTPWLIYLWGGALAWLYPITGGWFVVSLVAMGGVTVVHLWTRPPSRAQIR